jgi:hypothetical protein
VRDPSDQTTTPTTTGKARIMELTPAERRLVTEVFETILADDDNDMGFFDTSSSGAMRPEEVAEYRAEVAALLAKLTGREASTA